MKKLLKVISSLAVASLLSSCLTSGSSNTKPDFKPSSSVKKPEIIDHKDEKWGKTPPDWVLMDISEIESMDKYKDFYIFRFESEKSKDLEGAQLWIKNFQAPSELVRMISQRVEDTAASAVSGNKDSIAGYMEQLVTTINKATLNGVKKEADYWVQRRYFKADGKVDGDYYTVIMLYSIKKDTLDKLIQDAINGVEKPKTEEERKARDLVNKALTKHL